MCVCVEGQARRRRGRRRTARAQSKKPTLPLPLAAPRPYLPRLASSGPAATGASIASDADGGPPTPAFALAFNAVYCDTRLLAVAGEDGYVSVVDTGAPLPAGLCAGGGGGSDADASAAPPPPRARSGCATPTPCSTSPGPGTTPAS